MCLRYFTMCLKPSLRYVRLPDTFETLLLIFENFSDLCGTLHDMFEIPDMFETFHGVFEILPLFQFLLGLFETLTDLFQKLLEFKTLCCCLKSILVTWRCFLPHWRAFLLHFKQFTCLTLSDRVETNMFDLMTCLSHFLTYLGPCLIETS